VGIPACTLARPLGSRSIHCDLDNKRRLLSMGTCESTVCCDAETEQHSLQFDKCPDERSLNCFALPTHPGFELSPCPTYVYGL
jgi:hypothetical protein